MGGHHGAKRATFAWSVTRTSAVLHSSLRILLALKLLAHRHRPRQHRLRLPPLRLHHHQANTMKTPKMAAALMRWISQFKELLVLSARQLAVEARAQQMCLL